MGLPETIPVKYTEEEAEYLSVRPVVRQTFRRDELLDMLLSVAGKDVARLQQILRAGTAVYNFYRYWWQGFEAGAADLQAALAHFPDADPARPFRAAECSAAVFETGRESRDAEFRREEAGGKRWFRRASLWEWLMQVAEQRSPGYRTYSYTRRADVYEVVLTPEERAEVAVQVKRLGTRGVRARAPHVARAMRLLLICPRRESGR